MRNLIGRVITAVRAIGSSPGFEAVDRSKLSKAKATATSRGIIR